MEELNVAIKNEIDYYDTELESNPSFTPTQAEVLELAHLYSLSKYRDGDSGERVFYNIVNLPVEVASKMLDIDTRDIRLLGQDWNSYWPSWLKSRELNFWMKDKYFARQLNLYPVFLAKYGHLFVKKVADEVMIVDPRNLIVRPDVENLWETPIIEKHEKAMDSFLAEAKNRGWDTSGVETEADRIKYYECWFPKGYLSYQDNYFIFEPASQTILASTSQDEPHYKGLAWEKIFGRLLGRGQIEKLFKDQIYLNRIASYKADGLHWSSLHLFQSRDTNLMSNLLTEVENGDIIFGNAPLEPVRTEERNLQAYSYDEQRWEEAALRKSFSREPVTGERAPSGVPLGSTILQARMTAGFYDQKKENLASFIKEILWDWVLPSFEKANKKEHKILIENLVAGDEHSTEFLRLLTSKTMNKKVIEALGRGEYIDREQYGIMSGIEAEKIKREEFEIPKNFYSNLKHKIDITIVGENIDVAAKLSTLQVILQIVGSNPAVFDNPRTSKIIKKALDLSGFNPEDFDIDEPNLVQQVQSVRGGSVASPPVMSTPAALTETVRT